MFLQWPMFTGGRSMQDAACVKIYLVSHFASFWFDIYLYDEHSVHCAHAENILYFRPYNIICVLHTYSME